MKKITYFWLCTSIVSGITLFPSAAQAEYELYNNQAGVKLVFSAELAGAVMSSSNAYFGDSESFLGEKVNDWAELGFEPQLALEAPLAGGTFFGKLSYAYTNTFGDDASGLTIGEDKTHTFRVEQGHVGWKINDVFSFLEDDTFSVAIGRQDYLIGTGMLVADGGGDGGNRGGWWLGMRKTFKDTAIFRVKSKELLAEAFHIENQPRGGGTQGKADGGNLEYNFGDKLTLGGTYMLVDARLPGVDELDVYSGRFDWKLPQNFSFSGEYAHEKSDEIKADGWYAQLAYNAKDLPWSPVFSYRYARFDGDDPGTTRDEGFRSIAYGFSDWGTWYQGEITGEYPLGNSNLTSHLLRAKAQPIEKLTLNLMYYKFSLIEPASLGPGVTSDDWGDEVNLTADWQATDKLAVTGVIGVLFPGRAAEQYVGGGDSDWVHGMIWASYAF